MKANGPILDPIWGTGQFLLPLLEEGIINPKEKIMAAYLTPENTDDRKPIPSLVQGTKKLLSGDKSYVGSDFLSRF